MHITYNVNNNFGFFPFFFIGKLFWKIGCSSIEFNIVFRVHSIHRVYPGVLHPNDKDETLKHWMWCIEILGRRLHTIRVPGERLYSPIYEHTV